MAIEKMNLLEIISSLGNMHPILKELILSEKVHFNQNKENSISYNNYLAVHKYESDIEGLSTYDIASPDDTNKKFIDGLKYIEELSYGLGLELNIDKELLLDKKYSYKEARDDFSLIQDTLGKKVEKLKDNKEKIKEIRDLRKVADSISDKDIDFDKLGNLNFFDYEIVTFLAENRARLKKNYEHVSAIVLRIGNIKDSPELLYLVIYPKEFKEEAQNLLKSLNCGKIEIPQKYTGTPSQKVQQMDDEIDSLQKEINSIQNSIEAEKEYNEKMMNKIYSAFKLEEKIADLAGRVDFGNKAFAIDVWIQEEDKEEIEKAVASVASNYQISAKDGDDFSDDVVVPTKLKNNWFSKPFEMIVKMYDIPSYDEMDPTPLVAITFCLAFGMMFGDIGQGFIYVLAGLLLRKRMPDAAGIAIRLGASSMLFGCVYGSFFGLEQHQLPWLPSLIEGGVLTPENIPRILIVGIIFGIIVLSASYLWGIINHLKNHNIEEGVFGKNGIFGYMFFISFILTIVAITGIIDIPVTLTLTTLLVSLVIIILKQPIANLVEGHRPLFQEGAGSYLTQSIFEAIETILSTLSNSISFVRVGAFALNHAGLFLAFMVISEMMPNKFLEILMIVLGNLLILTLEGLIVLIQSLRLHYYEMFSKFFKGGGKLFKTIKL